MLFADGESKAMEIDDLKIERLARELAELTGESVPVAIRVALEERLERLFKKETLYEILRRVDALPRLDDRSVEEIFGYDKHGLPR